MFWRAGCTVLRAGGFSWSLKSPPSSVLDPWRFDTGYGSSSGFGSGPCSFLQWLSTLIKYIFFSPCLLLSVGIKTFERYRNFFLLLMEGSGSVQIIKRIRIQVAEKHRLRISLRNIASNQYHEPSLSGTVTGSQSCSPFFLYEAILSLHSQIGWWQWTQHYKLFNFYF